MTVRERVEEYIDSNQLIAQGDKVLVGVSGGADSVALLRMLAALGYGCEAVHCNFHLRGEESDRDQSFVERLCSELGIPLTVVHYDTVKYAEEHRCSIEMAARELRYNDFERLRAEKGCAAIAVAHHADDSVETVLMNLIRGTGLRGLTGIRPRNGFVIRPMLCLRRSEIEKWLNEIGQDFVTDSTNLECDYTRNKIRLRLLPMLRELNPDADGAISRTSERLAEACQVYRSGVERDIERCVASEDGLMTIDISELKQSASMESVLFEILSPYGYNDSQISDIMESLDAESGRRFMTSSAMLVKDRDCLILRENAASDCADCDIRLEIRDGYSASLPDGRVISVSMLSAGAPVERDSSVAMLDGDKIGKILVLRKWRNGDTFVPFGMKGRRLVSDFLTDRKMNLLDKQSQMVLCDGDRIVWVTGQRIDDRCRISDDTSCIVRISLKD